MVTRDPRYVGRFGILWDKGKGGTILSTEYGYQTLGIKLGAMSFKLNNNRY